mgnify:CR=1 FL=1
MLQVFDIIGPIMIGPSSSHTAGAVRIGKYARSVLGKKPVKAVIQFSGSFAKTYKGHGTDKAVIAGILGMDTDDARIRSSMQIATEEGLDFTFIEEDIDGAHPNTAEITLTDEAGRTALIRGASIGGGNIEIQSINGMDVSFGCDYPTLLIFHQDRPGVISSVTGVLAEHEINIAFMKVFRNSRWQNACMVIETDGEVEDCLVEQIRSENQDIVEVCKL